MLRKLAKATGSKSICLAGGVAFNCVANGKIFDSTPFEQVYVQPAAGDAGLAVGAGAYYVWHQKLGNATILRNGSRILGARILPALAEIRDAIKAIAMARQGYTMYGIAIPGASASERLQLSPRGKS